MNQEEAKVIAWKRICSLVPKKTVQISSTGVTEEPAEIEPVITKVIEKEYGWVFHWQSREYVESRNLRAMLIGNCPVLVTKQGETVLLPTAFPVEESLHRYEQGLPLLPGPAARTRQGQ